MECVGGGWLLAKGVDRWVRLVLSWRRSLGGIEFAGEGGGWLGEVGAFLAPFAGRDRVCWRRGGGRGRWCFSGAVCWAGSSLLAKGWWSGALVLFWRRLLVGIEFAGEGGGLLGEVG